ncbi:Pre-mRNA cleavage complex 2 protein Pcf11, partial [Stegodyphus mimosarum]
MRFKEIQSEQYSRHLDWHFRMNRREKDGAKKPFSRRLFYEIKDWIQFKEFEDLEERAPSYFELQADGGQSKAEEHEPICSVRAGECETEKCAVCGEQFQLFWVEEEEEWHLRHAVRHNEQAYHPACYEDFKKASESVETTNAEEMPSSPKEEAESDKTQLPSVSDELDVTCIKQEIIDDAEEIKTDTAVESSEHSDELSVKVEETNNSQNDDVSSEVSLDIKVEADIESHTASTDVGSSEQTNEDIEMTVVKMDTDVTEVQLNNAKETKVQVPDASEVDKQLPNTSEIKMETSAVKEGEEQSSDVKPDEKASTSLDIEEEPEFRPPTPDPRFQVMEPVSRGTELSALCCIM